MTARRPLLLRPSSAVHAFLVSSTFGAIALACAASPARAQGPGQPAATVPDTIVAVVIRGAATVDTTVVRSTFGIRPPVALSGELVREGLRNLWRSGLFSDVELDLEKDGRRLTFILQLEERRRLSQVVFSGNKKFDDDDLLKKSGLKAGVLLGPEQLAAAIDSITLAYHAAGYPLVGVRPTVLPEGDRQARVVIDVVEGAKVKVAALRFEGNAAVPAQVLYKQIKTKAKGGSFKEDVLKSDLKNLEAYYHDNGFRDAAVSDYRLDYSPDTSAVTITVVIHEGRKYSIAEVKWTGVSKLPEARLAEAVQVHAGDAYRESAIRKSLEGIYTAYQESGHLFLNVDPQVTSVDSTSLALTFAVEEGAPSSVRRVSITGNTRTKDKVIRREMSVRPGQTFRRSYIARSQRDVYALGFFEDVQVDYKPVAGSNDIDLVYTVKEKSTGTASAGAGYSNDVGLTGFVTLGIPNFLGNGQSVQLHLERGGRGGKRQNYSLSFTEPWLLDTPTVLGIDASYSTSERLGFPYLETVRSIGGRVGRPLRFIDHYTRGFLDLRTESLSRSDFDSAAVATDSTGYLVRLRDAHYPQTVTSTTLSLSRNSTNSPFYPTSGSRTTVSEELGGGPLGGFYKYHKDLLDTRVYLPLPLHGAALMLRARAGYVQGAPARIPDYEYFRLGGTTRNPLRGYPDNYIVPKGNSIYLGGRFATTYTGEIQFPIVSAVHGVLFLDAGNTWNSVTESQPGRLFLGAGPGVRLEIPGLGPIGFDYAYGFGRRKWESHFILGVGF